MALLSKQERKVARPGSRQHLTWGIGECGVCGGHLRMARKGAARMFEAALYVRADRGCTGRNQAQVDALVRAVVIERLSRPDALRWLAGDHRALSEVAERIQMARRRPRLAWDSLSSWPNAPADTLFAGSPAHASICATALSATQVEAHWTASR